MIQLENVTKRYPGGQEALSGLSFSVETGEMVFVTGHSGAGKSTLLRLIALIERPTSGEVVVDGQNTRRVRRRRIPRYRRQIGMVFQDHKLLYDRPVSENVALPLVIAGVGQREAGRRVRAALDQVGLLHKEKQNPETLSAGEQQRVGIARAIVTRPKLLIADEPTGNLDPDLSLEVMRIFRRFNEVGVTLLIASHDIALIDKLGCRRVELEEGRLQQSVDLEDYFEDVELPRGETDEWRWPGIRMRSHQYGLPARSQSGSRGISRPRGVRSAGSSISRSRVS
jgi:cell division transport system ATP-binding protein